MGSQKKSKKKGPSADQVRNRRNAKKTGQAHTVRTNPFEVKVNKQKHVVLGKKMTKFDKGLPGVSRSKSMKKRRDTLLKEMKNRGKANKLVDHRLGESDPTVTLEEKLMDRFALETKKRHQQASAYVLDDDNEDLTHGGQSLREIETFERPALDDDEDDGVLRGEHVSEGHFGGGMLQKKESGQEEKSWKDKMEEMISRSKQAKHEKQTEKEEIIQLTDQVDDEWRQIHNLIAGIKRKNQSLRVRSTKMKDGSWVAPNCGKVAVRGECALHSWPASGTHQSAVMAADVLLVVNLGWTSTRLRKPGAVPCYQPERPFAAQYRSSGRERVVGELMENGEVGADGEGEMELDETEVDNRDGVDEENWGSSEPDDDDDDKGPIDKKDKDFDVTVNELRFESRGTPSDRLKTEEEQAKDEKQRLEKLERERLQRMQGVTSNSTGRRFQSADDLNDGMDYDIQENHEFEVVYKDGKMVMPDVEDYEAYDSAGNVTASADVEGKAASPRKKSVSSRAPPRMEDLMEDGDGVSGSKGDNSSEVGSEGESSEEDEYSDLESDEEVVESESEQEQIQSKTVRGKSTKSKPPSPEPTSQLPFTFNVPKSYNDLVSLLEKYTATEQNTVLERMRKCNHASLAAENKDLLVRLYGFLLEYFGDASLRSPVPITLLDYLTRHLYQLALQFPCQTSALSKRIITERQRLFSAYCESRNGRGVWPFMDVLFYMKLLGSIYPTSDYRHEVITPVMLFATEIYASCAVNNHRDVAVSLLLSTIMLQYLSLSKKMMPECINLLTSLLHSAIPNHPQKKVTIGTSVCTTCLLSCEATADELKAMEVKPFDLNKVIVRGVGNSIYNTDEFRLTALHTTCTLLNLTATHSRQLPSCQALFSQAMSALRQLDSSIYPDKLQDRLSTLGPKLIDYICKERKKPRLLRLYEPTFEETFTLGKKKSSDSVVAERQKLRQQYKKELKSTMREVRRDREFVASQNIQNRRQRDAEREKKTNKIIADLQSQQFERNMHEKIKRDKK